MTRGSFYVVAILALALPMLAIEVGTDSQVIAVERNLQIPGGSLAPGHYTLSVEDRIPGRAIVRIIDAQTGQHQLLLAVPSSEIEKAAGSSIIFFDSPDGNKLTLRAWSCSNCDKPLEMVYPKSEAVRLTADTGQSVMAADPTFDRLPSNLSQEDMKVITLWLLKPERVSNHHGEGLKAVKYSVPATNVEPAANRKLLPQTSSDNFLLVLLGFLFCAAFLAVRLTRWHA